MNKIKPLVFLPPFLICVAAILLSFRNPESFNQSINAASEWSSSSFGWLISLASFGMVVLCCVIYLSPFGRTVLGGPGAKRLLKPWQMFTVVLTTNIAAGILFWCAYEPTNYLSKPPLGIVANSPEAAHFAISTIYLHWTFTPYCIPSVIGLMFAFAYYNMKRPFSLGAPLSPLLGRHGEGYVAQVIDAICLYALLAAIAAALAGAAMLLGSGINHVLATINHQPDSGPIVVGAPSSQMLAVIIGAIMVASVAAAISGVTKGIRYIANVNTWFLIGFLALIFSLGPTRFILNFAVEGLGQFLGNYVEKILFTGAAHQDKFANTYTQMLLAAFFAWGPIMGVFLGRIAYGYTVRAFLFFNVALPALFTGTWMAIFCSAIVFSERAHPGVLAGLLDDKDPTRVLFAFLSQLPLTNFLIPILLITAFLSFVTTADGCTDTMSNISTKGISPDNPESSMSIKIIWGTAIAVLAWSMVADARLAGVRNLSNLGGYPALLLGLAAAASAIKVVANPARFDQFHQDHAAQPTSEIES
ncbi:MAG: BCCT family transporter [Planctomycetes bacterium]|nr:BCCT family transporter [Planctomycetota bacterium]